MDDPTEQKAIEDAARAVHEIYFGADTWRPAAAAERSQARQAIRLMIAAFEKNGLSFRLPTGLDATPLSDERAASSQQPLPPSGGEMLKAVMNGEPPPRRRRSGA